MERKGSEISTYPKKNGLAYFFEPQSVAVIGPLKEGFFGGHPAIKNLLEAGFRGKIYPIDLSCSDVLGLKVHTSIKNLRQKIDLVMIVTDPKTIPTVMIECAERGVKAIIIVSDGFAERNEEGLLSEKKIFEIARQSGMRIIGPNTAGIINARNDLICCPYIMGQGKIRSGGIALCGQNRMISPHTFPYADFHYGVSKVCDLGNKSDVDESDMLEYLENDLPTKVIAMHIENIRDSKRFLEIARRVTHKKPLLVLRTGRTNQGGTASPPQTSSLLLDDQIFDTVCKQVGIIPLEKSGELLEIPKFFAYQPLPKGNKFGIISYTGMGAALAADEGAKYNLSVAKLSPETVTKLDAISPSLCKTIVDLGPLTALKSDYMSVYPEILKVVLADDNIDCLFHILWADPAGASVED
jgi:acyl-CoA synthetase (NDP forming)